MKKLFIALLFCALQAHAEQVNFDFRMMNVAQVVQLVYGEAFKTPYVIDPEVLQDTRQVSFRYESAKGDLRPFMANFLDSLGFSVKTTGGVDFIGKKPATVATTPEEEKEVLVYKPRYRDVSSLTKMLSPLVHGTFTTTRQIATKTPTPSDKKVPETSAAAAVETQTDTLVFQSTPKEVSMIKKLLEQLDTKLGEVMVRAAVYEVSSSSSDGSAFSLALTVLGSKLSLGLGNVASAQDGFIKFKNSTIDAVFSALSSDSRFSVVSRPSLRVQSGKSGHFTVGQDVPTLGAVTYPGDGRAPVQSVDYKSSGIIFDVVPTVYKESIDLHVKQQLSNFVETATGVNNSPTLIKREVQSDLSLSDGDIILLGGLAEEKNNETGSGFSFLPSFMKTKNTGKSNTEILLILQVKTL